MGKNEEDRLVGKVIRLMTDKGFGFIKDEKGTEYFFHRSATKEWETLQLESSVTFVPRNTDKGLRAEYVQPL